MEDVELMSLKTFGFLFGPSRSVEVETEIVKTSVCKDGRIEDRLWMQ